MSYRLILLLVFFLFVKQEADFAISVRKFVYQKDMSEYCRRRVMPSVFLGRQVMEAYSQILHFSRLELPYSCFVSIRTESGSNIILVIQLMSDKSLVESCRGSKNQLLVYEIGETFGGYWGALPNIVRKSEPSKDEYRYTLKTTQPTTTTTAEIRTTTRRTWLSTTETESSDDAVKKSSNHQDDIVVEVPIVNVSAKLVPDLPIEGIFDPEETFDTKFDVKPWPGVSYKTKVLPLVQFYKADEVSAVRTSDEADVSRYQVDFNADLFTPDSRLTFPLLRLSTKSKQHGKYKHNVNRRLDFKKNKKLLAEKEAFFFRKSLPSFDSQPSDLFTRPYDSMQPSSQKESEHVSNSWDLLDAILRNISKKDDVPNMKIDKNVANLLQGLAKIGHSESVFLVPNSSWHTRRPASTTPLISNKYRADSITWRQPSANYRTNYLEEVEDTSAVEGLLQDANKSPNPIKAMTNNDFVINNDVRSGALLPLALDVDRVILNVTQQNNTENSTIINTYILASEVNGTSTSGTTSETVKPMTLVDHESWENMVHAAPLMAVILNQSVTASVDDGKQGVNITLLSPSMRRKKRFIHAIPIEHAKPHHLPIKMEIPSSTMHTDKISDAQEFQRLIELQDDEIYDRVALRYQLRQYVGPALFNICDFKEVTARHIHLFNSSRLVLAITNFTLERMTVVMTPASTLLTSDARCASANLECQVSGARVCIDSLSACDGVPNCGSYDIYDEDRLTCGGSAGLQHNVSLAAITFLAVLLTILYMVHYWLKRCVPKVSDAFFIYTDAAENVLYLDTIMRSPYDTEDPKDYFRGAGIEDFMECTDMRMKKKTVGSYISRFFRLFLFKRKKRMSRDLRGQIFEEEYNAMHPNDQRLYPFAEIELGKMGSAFMNDAAVQTGSSLEIQVLEKISIAERMSQFDLETEGIVANYEDKRRSTDNRSIRGLDISSKQSSDELSILKFFKRARSVSMQMSPHEVKSAEFQPKHPAPTEEKEIQCLEYGHGLIFGNADRQPTDSTLTLTGETRDTTPKHGIVRKKLRFEEETRAIQPVSDDDALEEEIVPERRSVLYGSGKNVHLYDTDRSGNVEEPSTSMHREFKSYFWGGGKNKPKKLTKKKTQFSLH